MKKEVVVILGVVLLSVSLIGRISFFQNIAFAIALGVIAGLVLGIIKKMNK